MDGSRRRRRDGALLVCRSGIYLKTLSSLMMLGAVISYFVPSPFVLCGGMPVGFRSVDEIQQGLFCPEKKELNGMKMRADWPLTFSPGVL